MKKLIAVLMLIASPLLAGTYTDRFGIYLPDDGEAGWGTKIRQDFDIIDSSSPVLSSSNTFTAWNVFTTSITVSTVSVSGQVKIGTDTYTGSSRFAMDGTMTLGGGVAGATIQVCDQNYQNCALFTRTDVTIGGVSVCLEDGTNCPAGSVGGGIVSPGTFTWQNTKGISISTISATAFNATTTSMTVTGLLYVSSANIQALGVSTQSISNVLTVYGVSNTTTAVHVKAGNIGFPYGNAIVVSPDTTWASGTNKLIWTWFNGTDDQTDIFTPGAIRARPVISLRSNTGRVGVNTELPAKELDVAGEIKASSITITSLSASQCVQSDLNGNLISSGGSCGGAGGGSSTLQVTRSGVQITSPTASLSFFSSDFIGLAVGSTAQIALNPSTTNYIHNQTTLQSGTTAWPEILRVGSVMNTATSSLTITGTGGLVLSNPSGNGLVTFQPDGAHANANAIISTSSFIFNSTRSNTGGSSSWGFFDTIGPTSTNQTMSVQISPAISNYSNMTFDASALKISPTFDINRSPTQGANALSISPTFGGGVQAQENAAIKIGSSNGAAGSAYVNTSTGTSTDYGIYVDLSGVTSSSSTRVAGRFRSGGMLFEGPEVSTFTYGLVVGSLTVSDLTSGQCVQTTTGGRLTVTGSACGAGGGGASTLEVFIGAARSSPTASITANTSQFTGSVTGSTFTFTINTSSITALGPAIDGGSGGDITDASVTADDLGADSVGASELASTAIQSGDIEAGDLPSDGYASTYVNVTGDTMTGQLTNTSSVTVSGALGLAVTYGVTAGSVSINGSGGGVLDLTEGSGTTGVAGHTVFSSSQAWPSFIPNNLESYRIAATSTSVTVGQMAVWLSTKGALGSSAVPSADNLGNHTATTMLTAGYGINTTTMNATAFDATTTSVTVRGAGGFRTTYGIDAGSGTFTTFLNIPNGTGPTVDAVGKVAQDTTDNTLVIYDGTSAQVVGFSTHSVTVTISSGIGFNGLTIPVWRAPTDMAVTVNKIIAASLPTGTTVLYQLDERAVGTINTTGSSLFSVAFSTANNTSVSTVGGFSDASWAAEAPIILTTPASGAATGSPSMMTVTIYYTRNRE